MPQTSTSSANPQTPLRPLPSQTGSFGSHSSQEAGAQGDHSFKRQKSYPSGSMSMGYPTQASAGGSYQQPGQGQTPQSSYAPMAGQAGAAQGYPSMSSGGYGQQNFQFGASPYGNFSQNPYSYPVPSASYRPQQPNDPASFMSPFTSPNTQLPQQPAAAQQHQQQQAQQQQYPSQMSSGGYNYSSPSYSAYGSGGSAYSAQSSFAGQQQQQSQPAYQYGNPAQQQGQYGGQVRGRPMANPMSTPHLPPIKRPGSEGGEGDAQTQSQRGQQGYPPPGSGAQGGYSG